MHLYRRPTQHVETFPHTGNVSDEEGCCVIVKELWGVWACIDQKPVFSYRHLRVVTQQSEGGEPIHQDDSVNPPPEQVP